MIHPERRRENLKKIEEMDREKVIKGLECCLGANDCDVEPEEDCPYKGMCLCAMALHLDVLAMLKEQEAVKIEVKKINGSGRCGRCPNCLMELNEMDYPNYCGNCGQAVKWE